MLSEARVQGSQPAETGRGVTGLGFPPGPAQASLIVVRVALYPPGNTWQTPESEEGEAAAPCACGGLTGNGMAYGGFWWEKQGSGRGPWEWRSEGVPVWPGAGLSFPNCIVRGWVRLIGAGPAGGRKPSCHRGLGAPRFPVLSSGGARAGRGAAAAATRG